MSDLPEKKEISQEDSDKLDGDVLRSKLIKKTQTMIRKNKISKTDLFTIFEMFCDEKNKFSKNRTQHFFILNNYSDKTVSNIYNYLLKVEATHSYLNPPQTPNFRNSIANKIETPSNLSQVNMQQLVENRPNLLPPDQVVQRIRKESEGSHSTSIQDLLMRKKTQSQTEDPEEQSKKRKREPDENPDPNLIADNNSIESNQQQKKQKSDEDAESETSSMPVFTVDARLIDTFTMRPLSKYHIKKIMDSKRSAGSNIKGKLKKLIQTTNKLDAKPIHYLFKNSSSIFLGPKYDDMEIDYDFIEDEDIDPSQKDSVFNDNEDSNDDGEDDEGENINGDLDNDDMEDYDERSDFTDDEDESDEDNYDVSRDRLKRLSERYLSQ